MPRQCSICVHEKRNEIEGALVHGNSFRMIARAYSVSPDAVSRHKRNGHIALEIIEAKEVEVVSGRHDIWSNINFWAGELKAIFQEARKNGERSVALTAIDKALKLEALLMQASAVLGEGPREIDPATMAHEVMEYLREYHLKAHEGLVKHLRECYERDST